jgi:sugar O-acyltransferase (sialic acid O-acetyltransferase NeuD family)
MKKAIIGYGGHAREVSAQINEEVFFFVDDEYVLDGVRPLSELDIEKYKVMVAISDTNLREEIIKKLPSNTQFFTFIHPTALLLDDNIEIGKGSFIGAYSIITTNVKIGKHSILNRSCQIGHDVIVGDYLSMMPNSIISGNCEIGNNVYIGTNSSIREKIKICGDIKIGLNSGVVSDIHESGVYVGVPAKKINL